MVAETKQPGVKVAEVAARYGLLPNHISVWRSLARKGDLALSDRDLPAFVPISVQPDVPVNEERQRCAAAELRIAVSDVTLHVPAGFPARKVGARYESGSVAMSVSSDRNQRMRPLLFSTLPFCQGAEGLQK
ncbi:transposase [Novosphingobium sp. AAP83]|uniref:transposase n=1 Tax=Novosphingobium sp. AAP83 TaxID=1523425 RepID=UPI0009E9DEA8